MAKQPQASEYYRRLSEKGLRVFKRLSGERAKKKIAIIGWLGAFNLGDEMMLNVSLQILREWGYDITLITHKKDDKVLERYKGCDIIQRSTLTEEGIVSLAQTHDGFLINGGALIDDVNYDEGDSLTRDIARIAETFIGHGKRVVGYGLSTNASLENETLKADFKSIIEYAAHFSVRDVYSRDVLTEFVNPEEVKVVDDIVFADTVFARYKRTAVNTNGPIALILVAVPETMPTLKTFVKTLVQATDTPIRFISFYDENENDQAMYRQIKKSLGEDADKLGELVSPKDAAELKDALNDVSLVVSMRYHGILFANALGKPVVGLDYDLHRHYYNKNKYLNEHYAFYNTFVKLSDVDTLSADTLAGIIRAVRVPHANIKWIYRRARGDLLRALDLL